MDIDNEPKSPKPKKYKSIKRSLSFMLAWCVLIGAVLLAIKFWPHASPVPNDIKNQTNFNILYADGYSASADSWKLKGSPQTLTYAAKAKDYSVVFTEQAVPLAYQNDQAAYDRFIGGLRPKTNFTVPLGSVSIVNFVTAGDYNPTGPAGILKAKGTLLIAHPDQPLSDDQWRHLFESLKPD